MFHYRAGLEMDDYFSDRPSDHTGHRRYHPIVRRIHNLLPYCELLLLLVAALVPLDLELVVAEAVGPA